MLFFEYLESIILSKHNSGKMSLNSNYHYTRVVGHDEKDRPGQETSFKRFSSNLILIVICLFAGIIGFFVAQAGSKLAKEAPPDLECKPVLSLVPQG